MTKQEIDSLFQNESYDLATIKLRNALREDSSNAEWFYYLYLAENRDYANIDFDNVHNEMDLNHAIDLSNKRLRDFFDSEYNFYKAVDPYLRKFFTFASRENYKSFSSCLDSYSFKPTKLIHNYTDKNDFFSNLDYLVTIRIKPEIVYLNLLALNILYIVTKEEDVLSVWNTLKEKAKDANMESSDLKLFHTKEEIKESLHSYLNKKDNNKVVIEERKPDPKKEETPILTKVEEKSYVYQAQSFETKPEPAGPIKREDVKGKVNSLSGNQNSPSYIELFGIKITVFSIVLFVLSLILLIINVTNAGQSVIFSLIGITMFIKLVTLIGAIVGVNFEDIRVNGSIPALIICSFGIVVDIIGIIVTMGM